MKTAQENNSKKTADKKSIKKDTADKSVDKKSQKENPKAVKKSPAKK